MLLGEISFLQNIHDPIRIMRNKCANHVRKRDAANVDTFEGSGDWTPCKAQNSLCSNDNIMSSPSFLLRLNIESFAVIFFLSLLFFSLYKVLKLTH